MPAVPIILGTGTQPAQPSAGYETGYFDSADGYWKWVDSSNVVHKAVQYGDVALNPFSGQVINGQFLPTVASNNLTLTLYGMNGSVPSATNPVYVRIGNTVYSVTSALSVTANAGTNWLNSGASILATLSVDFFIYLSYNSTDGVVIGFARIPSALSFVDFNASTTNERGLIYSGSHSASTDSYVNVGRFAASLSASSAFQWSVPTYTWDNLVQRTITETRWLTWAPALTWTAGTAPTLSASLYQYRLNGNFASLNIYFLGTGGLTVTVVTFSLPIFTTNTTPIIGRGLLSPALTTVAATNAYYDYANNVFHLNSASASSLVALGWVDYPV